MSTVLASVVAAGFLWSLLLFFAAVVIREREQDAGFGWAIVGAILFIVTFCDRLPGHATAPRDLIKLLPGVPDDRVLFASSLVALVVLLFVYVLRVAVFYQLFLQDGRLIKDDGNEERVNDVVAPALSYLCFAICAVALLQPAYALGVIGTLLVIAALVAIHYWPLLRWLEDYIYIVRIRLIVAWARLRRRIRYLVLRAIFAIVWVEETRYRGGKRDLSKQRERLRALREEDAAARSHEDELLEEAAKRSFRYRRGQAKGAAVP